METSNYVSAPSSCMGGNHAWTYFGDLSLFKDKDRVFEGMPCQCGAMIGHYEVCPNCGHAEFQKIPRDEWVDDMEPKMVWDKNKSRYVESKEV
jgi:hypothetical protein